MKRRAFMLGLTAFSISRAKANTISYPKWFERDLQRKAAWLPDTIKKNGLEQAYEQRFQLFPSDIQENLTIWDMPKWYIALISTDPKSQYEINKQLRFMKDLAGQTPSNKYSARFEQLAYFAGAAQLPTLGDINTGKGLGNEGCSSCISHYLLSQMSLDFPELNKLDQGLFNSQSSSDMKRMFIESQKTNYIKVRQIEFNHLKREDFYPGTILIAVKPGGTHVMAVTRVARNWNWDQQDLMMIGNTGLPGFGDRMCLAQDYITSDINIKTFNPTELKHNLHGPINLRMLPMKDKDEVCTSIVERSPVGCLSNPTTNIYAAKNATFFMVDFLDPEIE